MRITVDAGRSRAQKERITIERTYKARIKDVWALWTTKEGLESWWGPGGSPFWYEASICVPVVSSHMR